MNRAAVIKHWSVIEAFRYGKQVEWRECANNNWKAIDEPSFILAHEYRVKPEKKEMWVNVYEFSVTKYPNKESADRGAMPMRRLACVKVVYEEGEGL